MMGFLSPQMVTSQLGMGLFEQDSRLSTRAGSTVVLMGACCLAIFVQSESVNLEGTTVHHGKPALMCISA